MGKKQKSKNKKIEKLIKKQELPRTFHPAVRLLQRADSELAPIAALAAELGIAFSEAAHGEGRFQAATANDPGEARMAAIFAELVRVNSKNDVRIGLRLTYYQTVKNRKAIADVTLSRLHSEREWTLVCVLRSGFTRPELDVSHSVRRLGGSFSEPRAFGPTAGIAKVAVKMLQDYRDHVLIPRYIRRRKEGRSTSD